MITTISSKGQVVLPAELWQRDNIRAGDEFEVERNKEEEAGAEPATVGSRQSQCPA